MIRDDGLSLHPDFPFILQKLEARYQATQDIASTRPNKGMDSTLFCGRKIAAILKRRFSPKDVLID